MERYPTLYSPTGQETSKTRQTANAQQLTSRPSTNSNRLNYTIRFNSETTDRQYTRRMNKQGCNQRLERKKRETTEAICEESNTANARAYDVSHLVKR